VSVAAIWARSDQSSLTFVGGVERLTAARVAVDDGMAAAGSTRATEDTKAVPKG
jgi:hypothetical protein